MSSFFRQLAQVVSWKDIRIRDGSLSKVVNPILQKLCIKYDNLTEIDKLASISKKVESVTLTMQQNIDMALRNCVTLDSIQLSTEDLQQKANIFRHNAQDLKNKLWWKDFRVSFPSKFDFLVHI